MAVSGERKERHWEGGRRQGPVAAGDCDILKGTASEEGPRAAVLLAFVFIPQTRFAQAHAHEATVFLDTKSGKPGALFSLILGCFLARRCSRLPPRRIISGLLYRRGSCRPSARAIQFPPFFALLWPVPTVRCHAAMEHTFSKRQHADEKIHLECTPLYWSVHS